MPPQDKGILKEDEILQSPIEELKRGKNYLFAIGINTYKDFKPLSNARKDIEDVADVLVKNYYFERENIHLLCDDKATKDNILDELEGLRKKVKAEDRLLIYYSGHGYLDDGRGFWIPVNAKRNQVSSFIRNAEVRDIIQSIKARHILLISDSCFSANLLVRDATRDISGAFMDWERNPSRWIFISGKGVVSDGTAGTNSPFANAILKHLRQNNDDALNIVRLADRVTTEVRFNYEQQAEISPLYQSGHEGGQFVFLKRQTEKDDWTNAVRLNTEGVYLAYLKKYPNGQFEKEAEEKLIEIADEKEWKTADLRDAAFAYRQYLKKYPQGIHALEAHARLHKIEEKEAERIAKIEADKKEAERIAKIEADKKEAERIAKIEADKKEAERIAKIEADKKEAERIAKIEADKKEAERIAKIEVDKKEAERIAKIEADKKEAERIAKIEVDRRETELQIKFDAEKKEAELYFIEKEEEERKEQEILSEIEIKNKEAEWLEQEKIEQNTLLATIEADRKENEELEKELTLKQLKYKRKIDTIKENLNNKPVEVEDSIFKKYKFIIGGGGALATGLLIWQMTKQPSGPTVNPTNEPVTQQPIVDNTKANKQEGVKTLDPKTLPSNVSVGKTADKQKTQPQRSKPTPDLFPEEVKQPDIDSRKIDNANTIAEQKKQQQIQADKTTAQKYLKTALANIAAEEYNDAKKALSNAASLSTLSATAKKAISTALANISAEEYGDAKKAINMALSATN
jgi:hypothetical protein